MNRLEWHKSSYSDGTGGNCVEIAETSIAVHMRDTQNRELGLLAFPSGEWASFLYDLKSAAAQV